MTAPVAVESTFAAAPFAVAVTSTGQGEALHRAVLRRTATPTVPQCWGTRIMPSWATDATRRPSW